MSSYFLQEDVHYGLYILKVMLFNRNADGVTVSQTGYNSPLFGKNSEILPSA